MRKPLSPAFYYGSTVEVARALLGKLLVHQSSEGVTSGIIVETEAYLYPDDPACHASRGQTKRNKVMFGPPGRAYVYFTYGNHWLLNAVTGEIGIGEAVLIRALEPFEGIELMKKRRGIEKLELLTQGPGRLTQAMGIDGRYNGANLAEEPLFVAPGWEKELLVASSPRIGVRQDCEQELRYFLAGNQFVCRRRS